MNWSPFVAFFKAARTGSDFAATVLPPVPGDKGPGGAGARPASPEFVANAMPPASFLGVLFLLLELDGLHRDGRGVHVILERRDQFRVGDGPEERVAGQL